MNVLIIGLGYAGHRFQQAFETVSNRRNETMNIAYVDPAVVVQPLKQFHSIKDALLKHRPDIVVVAVTDGEHCDVLHQLKNYHGFVICEKPLVNSGDDLYQLAGCMASVSGFCMDMVERYSDVTRELREFVAREELVLARAHFIWGKDRINDHRRTSGAVSEIIHSLDLIEYIAGSGEYLRCQNAVGAYSDFSVSGCSVLDSLFVTAHLNQAVVTGYSSFVNIVRQRTLDFVFVKPDGGNVYAQAIFDTPAWDQDTLKVWDPDNADALILDIVTENGSAQMPVKTIGKLSRLVEAVMDNVLTQKQPIVPFCGLDESLHLQQLLNTMELQAVSAGKYSIRGNRQPANPLTQSLEKLG